MISVEALQARGKDFLLRMFDIREGEFQRVLLMQFNIFLIILCLLIIKPVVNAHFLSLVGVSKLPLVFLLVALTALMVSTIYSRLLNRISLGKIISRTYLTSILGILALAIFLQLNLFETWIIYVFYIGVALFSLLTTSQFWILASLVFNSLEAKRLFGFIGAGAIAGGVSGGYLTSVLAPVIDTTYLLFVAVLLLMIGMWVNRKIWKSYVPSFDRSVQIRQTKTISEHPLRIIRNSKHLSYLALIMGISVVVAKLVEYQFSAIASDRFADPDELAGFFGFWFSTFNVVSLGIQLFLTQRIVGMFGVGRSLFVLPGALLAGAVSVIINPILWTGVMLKLFDVSLKQSINKAATELLILPIPMAVKSQAKTFIDVFVDTTATGIGGILLLFLVNGFHLSVQAVSVLIVFLIAIWIYFAIQIRKEYIQSFQNNLTPTKVPLRKKGFQLSTESAVESIRKALQSGSEKQILYLLPWIEDSKDQRLMADTLPLLNHSSALVRNAALRCLYYAKDHSISEKFIPLLHDPDDEVRYRAFSSLLAHNRHNRVNVIRDYLLHEDPIINGAALVGLATESRNNPEMKGMFNIEQRIHDKLNYVEMLGDSSLVSSYKIMIARAIGYGRLEKFYPILIQYLKDKDSEVMENAISAAGNSRDPLFVTELLPFLPQRTTRLQARKAIANLEPVEVLQILTDLVTKNQLNNEVLVQLPPLTKSMDTQKAVDFLFELIRHRDIAVKLEALQSLLFMKEQFPYLTINNTKLMQLLMSEVNLYKDTLVLSYSASRSLNTDILHLETNKSNDDLTNLLERRLDNTLERIFQLLGLKYPLTDILPVYEGIRNRDPQVRINAVDFLDNILEPNLKQVLLPIVESAMMDTLSEDIMKRMKIEPLSELSCFEALLKGTDDRIKIAVLNLLESHQHPMRASLAQIVAEDENVKVVNLAHRIIQQGSSIE